jgi:hypothetical protein
VEKMQIDRDFFQHSARDYQESQMLSEKLDDLLGYQTNSIEKKLVQLASRLDPFGDLKSWGIRMHDGAQSWVGLNPQQLQTTYDELVELVDVIQPDPHSLWLDLGAGYGRLGIVLKALAPEVKFIGYEIVRERVVDGNRVFKKHCCEDATLVCADISKNFDLPIADCYFIYDYGKLEHIKKTLEQISFIADQGHHFHVVARGRVRQFIEYNHPWLTVNNPTNTSTFNIYRY